MFAIIVGGVLVLGISAIFGLQGLPRLLNPEYYALMAIVP